MTVETKWYGAENQKVYEQAAKVGLTACAIDIQGQAKVILTQFPRVDTGRLRNSIGYVTTNKSMNDPSDGVQSKPKEFEAIVGTNVSYAAYVEYGTGKYAIGGRSTPWVYKDPKTGKFVRTSGMRMCPFLRLSKDMRAPFLNTIFQKEVIKYVAANSKAI